MWKHITELSYECELFFDRRQQIIKESSDLDYEDWYHNYEKRTPSELESNWWTPVSMVTAHPSICHDTYSVTYTLLIAKDADEQWAKHATHYFQIMHTP